MSSNAREIIEKLKSNGIEDPEIVCKIHKVKKKLSELDPIQILALEEGIDVAEDLQCIFDR